MTEEDIDPEKFYSPATNGDLALVAMQTAAALAQMRAIASSLCSGNSQGAFEQIKQAQEVTEALYAKASALIARSPGGPNDGVLNLRLRMTAFGPGERRKKKSAGSGE
jgi:hypothetical protein